jgi:6-phosphogluconolactonase
MSNSELIFFATDDELARAVANRWLDELSASDRDKPYCVALSGGRITKKFFVAVAEHSRTRARSVSLDSIHFFWADERCVPPTDPESNFALAREHLLAPLGIQPDKIHRLRGEIPPKLAAAEAEAEICRIAPMDGSGQPVLDLIFLGMGEDGHVASLFPGSPDEIVESKAIYLPVVASKPPPNRITINYATLTAAKQVWVLASGAGKELALQESLSPQGRTPLARVVRARRRTLIFSDIRRDAPG